MTTARCSNIAAVVTGGASALGEATARVLAGRGVKSRSSTATRTTPQGGGRDRRRVRRGPVTSNEAVDAGFAKARESHGQERICVNCAGAANAMMTVGRDEQTGEIKRYPIGQFELVIQIILIGTFRVLAASAPAFAALSIHDAVVALVEPAEVNGSEEHGPDTVANLFETHLFAAAVLHGIGASTRGEVLSYENCKRSARNEV